MPVRVALYVQNSALFVGRSSSQAGYGLPSVVLPLRIAP